LPLCQQLRAGRQTDGQRFASVRPRQIESHPFALAVCEAVAFVFVLEKLSVGAGVYGQGQWRIYFFRSVLLHGAARNDRAGPNVQRYGREIDVAGDLAASLQALAGPPVVPGSTGQVELPRRRALLDYGCDQDVAAPEVLVAARDRGRVVRIV